MTFQKPSPQDIAWLCGEIGPEDGMDPRRFGRKGWSHRGSRKDRQLCSQVAETLSMVLSGECDDDVLQSLQVVAVDPAPNASQLLVTVAPSLPDDIVDAAEAIDRLTKMSAKLRCEVAAAITRKRAPKLVFRII